jgi:hypothetical protein
MYFLSEIEIQEFSGHGGRMTAATGGRRRGARFWIDWKSPDVFCPVVFGCFLFLTGPAGPPFTRSALRERNRAGKQHVATLSPVVTGRCQK